MINEAISMATVGNMTIQYAAEYKYIKKYIIKRFNSKGIKVKLKNSYDGQHYDKSKLKTSLFKGFTIYLHDEGLASSGDKMSMSNFSVEFSTQGNKVVVKFVLYNDKVEKTIPINDTKMASFMDEVLSLYSSAKKELLQIHQTKHAARGGFTYNDQANRAKLEEIAKGFNYKGCTIRYRDNGYSSRYSNSYHNSNPTLVLEIKYEHTSNSSKHKLATVVKKLFQDPTVKRYMEKDDKLDKDFSWGFGYNAPQYEANYDFIKEAINAFVNYIDGRTDISIKYVSYNKLEIGILKSGTGGMKSYHAKKEMIEGVNSQIKSMNKGFDRIIEKTPKYGQLLMKRFWAKPEKYI